MSRSRRRSPLWAIAPLVLLLFSGWQAVAVLAREPAFNTSLHVTAPEGLRIPPGTHAYFDRAAYAYWTARLWFGLGRELTPDPEEADGEGAEVSALAEPDPRVLEAFQTARDSARRTVSLSPGDPTAWMLLARSELALGDRTAALDAYDKCFALAPHNEVLAAERIRFVIAFLWTPDGPQTDHSMFEPERVRSDLEAMKIRLGKVGAFFAETPEIRAVLGAPEDAG